MKKKFKVGDKVRTSTHAVYQNTQETLNDLTGVIMNTDDYPYNIHVKIDNKPTWGNIGFSEFELTKIDDKREVLESILRDDVMDEMERDFAVSDRTAIDELLTFVPVENLIEFLPEETWKKFKSLRK